MPAMVTTPAEYEALPEGRRLELIEGVVHATAPAERRHQRVVSRLERILAELSPDGLVAVREQELRMHDCLQRVPDVMVVRAEADDDDRYWFGARATVMVAEVVGEQTEITDRLHKPGEYAEAGIEYYWRIETRPAIEVHTFQLGPQGSYISTGKFVEGDVVAAAGLPWAKVAVSDLTA